MQKGKEKEEDRWAEGQGGEQDEMREKKGRKKESDRNTKKGKGGRRQVGRGTGR